MNRPIRGPLVVFLAALLVIASLGVAAAEGPGNTAPSDRSPEPSPGRLSHGEALEVLTEAKRLLRPDSRRVRARKSVGHGADTDITMTLRDLFVARQALSGADRRAADLMLSRSPVSAGRTGLIAVTTPSTQCSVNFCVHYRPAPMSQYATTKHVQATLSTLEHVRAYETRTLGYRIPVTDTPEAPTPDNPDSRFDVFLGDIAREGLYGYCAPDGAQPAPVDGRAAAFCVLDNDYAAIEYGAAPLSSLRVTAAHEFFHAIQFAYDVYEDLWFMEGTAAWVEDEVYDSINDNYQYLAESPIRRPRRALDYSVGMHPYGSFLFFKYAAERLRNRSVVRQFWDHAAFPRKRYSLQAIRAVMAARRVSWPVFYAGFASWNTLPAASFSERAGYPRPVLTLSQKLTKRARSTGRRSVSLPHLASSSIRVAPGNQLGHRKKLLVEVNAPHTSHGATALVQRRLRSGAVTHSMMPLDARGNGRLLIRFNRRVLASVYVVVSNTSTTMRDCGRVGDGRGRPVYACSGRGYYDLGQTFVVRATLR